MALKKFTIRNIVTLTPKGFYACRRKDIISEVQSYVKLCNNWQKTLNFGAKMPLFEVTVKDGNMIELNIDLTYLAQHFEVGASRLNKYATKNIKEIMEQEAKVGNTKAKDFLSILKDPAEVEKLFRLSDSFNRFMIIKNMSMADVRKLLKHLSKQDLIWGIKYFSLDKIMELLMELPKKELLRLVFENFTLKDILKLMPTDKMDAFLKNEKVQREDIMKYFQQLEKKDLERIMSGILNRDMENADRETMLAFMDSLDDRKFKEFILKMQREDKSNLIMALCKEKPKLMLEFDNEDIAKPLIELDKADLLKSMMVLDEKYLIAMVEELPDDLLVLVATQIDPAIFADILVNEFADILAQVAF